VTRPAKKPPKTGATKWGPAIKAVTDGKTIHFPNLRPEKVVGSLTRPSQKADGYVIRSRVHRNGGTVVWMEKR